MGGTCTNDGRVPTRVLARAARLARDAEQFVDYGLDGEVPRVDFARLLARAQRVVYTVHEKKQMLGRLEAAGVQVLDRAGDARFLDPHTLALGDGRRLEGEKFILCAGGHARRFPFPGGEHALTHSDVWSMKSLPRSVAVVARRRPAASPPRCSLPSVRGCGCWRSRRASWAPRTRSFRAEWPGRSRGGASRSLPASAGSSGSRENGGLRLFYSR